MKISIAACRCGEDIPVNGKGEWWVRRDKGGRHRGWPRASSTMSDDERRWWAAAVAVSTSMKTAAAVVGNCRLQLAGCRSRPQSQESAPPISSSRTNTYIHTHNTHTHIYIYIYRCKFLIVKWRRCHK